MRDYKAKVVFNRKAGADCYHMKLSLDSGIKALPGQFVQLLVSDAYEPLLRRPFSIYDAGNKHVELLYKVIGEGTRIMAEKKPGDMMKMLGPLGNSYIDFLNSKSKGKCILVGGGTGAASVHYFAKSLKSKKKKFTLIQGARNASLILNKEGFKKLKAVFATEDGSLGEKGLVTDVLKKVLKPGDTVFCCGPKAMTKAILSLTGNSVRTFASLEEYMGCGVGACLSCVVQVKDNNPDGFVYRRVCKDGTIFNCENLIL